MKKLFLIICIMLFIIVGTSTNALNAVSENIEKINNEIDVNFNLYYNFKDISIISNLKGPVVVITSPDNGSTVDEPFIDVIVYANDETGLNHFEYLWEWSTGSKGSSGSFFPTTNVVFTANLTDITPGVYKFTVTFFNISGASASDSVTVTYIPNYPPSTPLKPDGPATGNIGELYYYSTVSYDMENEYIKYGWDWNGDDSIDEWKIFRPSGSVCTANHIWYQAGTYNVKVVAEDESGHRSSFSEALTVTIMDNTTPNNPPNKPGKPNGPQTGKIGISYTYTVAAIDPENDMIYYKFDWDDGETSEWIGPYNSGQTASASHIWEVEGSYSIKVKAKDSNGLESIWSDPLSITMPKKKNTYTIFYDFYQKIINLYGIIFDKVML